VCAPCSVPVSIVTVSSSAVSPHAASARTRSQSADLHVRCDIGKELTSPWRSAGTARSGGLVMALFTKHRLAFATLAAAACGGNDTAPPADANTPPQAVLTRPSRSSTIALADDGAH